MAPVAVASAGGMPATISNAITSECDNVEIPPDTMKRSISEARVFLSAGNVFAPEDTFDVPD